MRWRGRSFSLLDALLVNKGRGKGDNSDAQENTRLSLQQLPGEGSSRSRQVPFGFTETFLQETGSFCQGGLKTHDDNTSPTTTLSLNNLSKAPLARGTFLGAAGVKHIPYK